MQYTKKSKKVLILNAYIIQHKKRHILLINTDRACNRYLLLHLPQTGLNIYLVTYKVASSGNLIFY